MLEVSIVEKVDSHLTIFLKKPQLSPDVFLLCDFTDRFASLSKENGHDRFRILTQVALQLPTRVEDF